MRVTYLGLTYTVNTDAEIRMLCYALGIRKAS